MVGAEDEMATNINILPPNSSVRIPVPGSPVIGLVRMEVSGVGFHLEIQSSQKSKSNPILTGCNGANPVSDLS